MASRIFEKIVERNIEQFVGHFSDDSSVIYKDEKINLYIQVNMVNIEKNHASN